MPIALIYVAAAKAANPHIHISPKLAALIAGVGALAVASRYLEQRDRERRRAARKERKREYRRYLRSDGWRQRRLQAVDRSEGLCEDCGAKRDLDVHHRTYARKGAERPEDLRALCRQCHTARHKGDRTTFDWIGLAILRWYRKRRHRSAATDASL